VPFGRGGFHAPLRRPVARSRTQLAELIPHAGERRMLPVLDLDPARPAR
jgi:hypothetical protein